MTRWKFMFIPDRAIWLLSLLSVFAQLARAADPPGVPQPPPPLPPSPIQQFRDWLVMKPEQRTNAVAGWPADKQKILLAKLSAYEALPLSERERRLQMLELRWYLRPLMSMPAEERQKALPLVPSPLRALVVERLRNWDSLDPNARREILANDDARELVTKYYLQLQQGRSREEIMNSLDPQRRAEIENAFATWNAIPAAARARTAAQLTAFFELSPEEQARTFQGLPESERQDIQKTLEAFAKLSPEQRRLCVESFEKFTRMPAADRASFLRNAARWEAMTPQERTTWKELVTKLPPLPPVPVSQPPTPQASTGTRGMAQGTTPGGQ